MNRILHPLVEYSLLRDKRVLYARFISTSSAQKFSSAKLKCTTLYSAYLQKFEIERMENLAANILLFSARPNYGQEPKQAHALGKWFFQIIQFELYCYRID